MDSCTTSHPFLRTHVVELYFFTETIQQKNLPLIHFFATLDSLTNCQLMVCVDMIRTKANRRTITVKARGFALSCDAALARHLPEDKV